MADYGKIGTGLQAGGDILSGFAQYSQGKLARSIGRMRRASSDQAAKQVVASAQRVALEDKRQAELIASRAVAVAAAGGGGVNDPTVINLLEDIEAEGAYRAAVAMYEGESQADKIRYEGQLEEIAGESAYDQGQLALFGGFLSAGGRVLGGM